MEEIIISTEKEKLNLKLIYNFISKCYWGEGRTFSEIEKCVQNSLNFGIYLNGSQIGYARVVTDYCIFAYILDVFIIESERGKGYSVRLIDAVMNHPELIVVKTWKLATSDAHALYDKFGFIPLENPEYNMERKYTIQKNGHSGIS